MIVLTLSESKSKLLLSDEMRDVGIWRWLALFGDSLLDSSNTKLPRKMKKRLGPSTYSSINSTASGPGRFYGTAKLRKLNQGCKDVNQLSITPILSNISTASCKTSHYTAELLAPLTKSEYSINSTEKFISKIKNLKVNKDQDMVSFNISNLFTIVPQNSL